VKWRRVLVSDDHIVVLQEFLDILDKHTSWFFCSNIIALGVAKAEQLCESYRDRGFALVGGVKVSPLGQAEDK
jgi:hypothetical protein